MRRLALCLLGLLAAALPLAAAPAEGGAVSVAVNGAARFQTIDGFGVNANSEGWDEDALPPALDTLADTVGVTLWRVIVEEADWEAANDNADPGSFNWASYNQIYAGGEFPGLWALIGYLNQRADSRVMLNVMGRVPDWMGRTVVDEDKEDEWVEMIASLVVYARETKGLEFDLLSPTNEVDIGSPEGPQLPPAQYARLIKKLIERLAALGHADISIVPPDIAIVDQAPSYLPPLLADPAIMAKVRHFSFHDYGGRSGEVPALIAASAYPDRTYWMTEFSAGCAGCDAGQRPTDPWNFGFLTADLLLRHLAQGAAGAFVYEGYDSYYDHHNAFGYWGLLAYDEASRRFEPTKRLYLVAQVFRFVRPGMVRLGVTSPDPDLQVMAFLDPASGDLAFLARNPVGDARTLQVTLSGLAAPAALQHHRTSQSEDLARLPDVALAGASFTLELPGLSFSTLTAPGDQPTPTASATATTTATPTASATATTTATPTASATAGPAPRSQLFLPALCHSPSLRAR